MYMCFDMALLDKISLTCAYTGSRKMPGPQTPDDMHFVCCDKRFFAIPHSASCNPEERSYGMGTANVSIACPNTALWLAAFSLLATCPQVEGMLRRHSNHRGRAMTADCTVAASPTLPG